MKLLLVDDQTLFLESLKIVIENIAEDMKVIATANNGEVAIQKVEEFNPDVILMDVRMPVMDGVQATKAIKTKYPNIDIIMLTTFDDDEYVKDALKNGAAGYMLKNIEPQMLISSIRAVVSGAVLISPTIAGNLIDHVKESETEKEKEEIPIPYWFNELNEREKVILKHIVDGKTNTEIADIIFVGPQTIRNYISSLYSKLEVNNRAHAIRKASELPMSLLKGIN